MYIKLYYSSILIVKCFAGDNISKASKSSEQAISLCLMEAGAITQSSLLKVNSPSPT